MSLTSWLYKAARLSNTLRAVRKGPTAIAKRQVRKAAYRGVNKQLGRFLKKGGLW